MNDLAETGMATAPLANNIQIQSVYTRAINLARDGGALELIAAYRPTSRARQCLRQMAGGLSAEPRPRALAAIGHTELASCITLNAGNLRVFSLRSPPLSAGWQTRSARGIVRPAHLPKYSLMRSPAKSRKRR